MMTTRSQSLMIIGQISSVIIELPEDFYHNLCFNMCKNIFTTATSALPGLIESAHATSDPSQHPHHGRASLRPAQHVGQSRVRSVE